MKIYRNHGRGKLTRTVATALRLCQYQHRRARSGGRVETVSRSARRLGVSERTIYRWIAVATELGALKITRTGRRPKWVVNTARIAELRGQASQSWGRNRAGRLSEKARNTRWGYKAALFAHYGCPPKAGEKVPDLTKKAPHTPYGITTFGVYPGIGSRSSSSLPDLHRARPQPVVADRQTVIGTLFLKLALRAGDGTKRAAARALASSGLIRGESGAPLRGNEARALLGHKPRYRANGSDCERNATALQEKEESTNGNP